MSSIDFTIKRYSELTRDELYELMKLRSEVFVVEQNSVYLDVDGKDDKALHVLGVKNGKLVAYSRLFNAGVYFDEASIGRVVVAKKERKNDYGHALFEFSIQSVIQYFKTETIKISAQAYLEKFYSSHGFIAEGEGYLEDGIPHIAMYRNKLSS
ncbi:MAG: GNAT family N-acetyltransferase [Flavicella sp.]